MGSETSRTSFGSMGRILEAKVWSASSAAPNVVTTWGLHHSHGRFLGKDEAFNLDGMGLFPWFFFEFPMMQILLPLLLQAMCIH